MLQIDAGEQLAPLLLLIDIGLPPSLEPLDDPGVGLLGDLNVR